MYSRNGWVRVSNAIQDPVTKCSVAQDQIVKGVGEDGDWLIIESLEGSPGRVPKVLALPVADPPRGDGQYLYCSTDVYSSVRADDLPFGQYCLFVASPSKTHDGWLEGFAVKDDGSQLGPPGLLPEGYLVHLRLASDSASCTSSGTGRMLPTSFTTNFDDVRFRGDGNDTSRSQPSTNGGAYNVAPYARANYDFQGEFANELSFVADEMITLRKRIDAEWLEGSVGSRVGIFPASFVQIIVDLPDENARHSNAASVASATNSASNKRRSATDDGIGFATVRHQFQGREQDELTVSGGDTVRVLRLVNDEWVMCKDPDTERTGIVPIGFLELYLDDDDDDVMTRGGGAKNHSPADTTVSTLNRDSFAAPSSIADWRTSTRIEDWSGTSSATAASMSNNQQWATFGEEWIAADTTPRSAAPARPPPPKQTSMQSPNDIVSVTEMFGMIERQAPPRPNAPTSMFATSNDLHLAGLDSTSTQEEKRAKIFEELINSELQYITDINCYTEAVEGSTFLNAKQKVVMRNGCAQIVQLSGTLVQHLTNEQLKPMEQQAIGACFLQLRKAFAQTYGFYFRNIEHINQLLTSAKTERAMEEALNDVVQRMRLAGAGVIDGATAVGRPVQRCLKYPLFLSELLKHTAVTHTDHPKMMEAMKQMSNLGQKMNESKRRKELTRKYTEEEGPQSFGDMLSKLTIHSLKKKSNRFTYRMGSSLGVVKLTRDSEFDKLVCDLDTAERRLVRFNYMLVIYRKKMFHETRVILHKKLIEPRKKQVSASDADHQLYQFHELVKDFSGLINSKVRDGIVRALRGLPKKLIKKRNDKLMDYEAAKSKDKTSQMRSEAREKFNDYEALNAQVKQQLPKSIDNLNRVLSEAMRTVQGEDETLMTKLKTSFEEQKRIAAGDPNSQNRRLILADSVCFTNFYDPDRLKPLAKIANKAAQSLRIRARSASPDKQRKEKKNGTTETKPPKKQATMDLNASSLQDQWRSGAPTVESFYNATTTSSAATASGGGTKFRAQTSDERRTIIDKAKAKGRLGDMYVVMYAYPNDKHLYELAVKEGKLLIVAPEDLVLAVNREVPSMWLCYNGYYNAMLPSAVLRPYNSQAPSIEMGVDVARQLGAASTFNTRSQSTPPKSQNLIDLEDLFGDGSSLTSAQPAPTVFGGGMQLSPIPLQPTNVARADTNPTSTQLQSRPPPDSLGLLAGPNFNIDSASLFEGVKPVDWGASSTAVRTPSLPNLNVAASSSVAATSSTVTSAMFGNAAAATAWGQPTSPRFPVIFDENSDPFSTSGVASVYPNLSSAAGSSNGGMASTSSASLNQRSDSPQPLIPSRPAPMVKNSLPFAAQTPPALPRPVQTQPMQQQRSAFAGLASYDSVPLNETSSMLYAIPPMYDVTPGSTSVLPPPSMLMYDVPPSERYATTPAAPAYVQSQYDSPPVETPKNDKIMRPVLGEVRIDYDFVPQGGNQLAVKEGEVLGIVQRTDDDGNPEWLLIQRPNGSVGYVPAAYCRSL